MISLWWHDLKMADETKVEGCAVLAKSLKEQVSMVHFDLLLTAVERMYFLSRMLFIIRNCKFY